MVMTVLGHDIVTNEPVGFPEEARSAGFYIIGGTRMGKSSLIETLALADMQAGRGLCIIDPHGRLVDRMLRFVPEERADDVILLDPSDEEYPFGLNLYHCPNPAKRALLARQAGQATGIFQKLWPDAWGARVDQVTRNSAYTFLEHPGAEVEGRRLPYTMAEIPLLLSQKTFRHSLVRAITNRPVQQFWELQFDRWGRDEVANTESTLNKVGAFLENPIIYTIVGQSESTVDFRKAMHEGKLIFVRMAAAGDKDPIVALVGALIIAHILNAALSREDTPQRELTPFRLYVDEYHRFITPDLAAILTDTGKYELGTTVAHQARNQLDEDSRTATGQVGAFAIFRVGPDDADELAGYFDTTPGQGSIIGERSKTAVPLDPTRHLLTAPPNHPDILGFVRLYLKPIYDRLDEARRDAPHGPEMVYPPQAYGYETGPYESEESERHRVRGERDSQELPKAIQRLDRYFHGEMVSPEDKRYRLFGVLVYLQRRFRCQFAYEALLNTGHQDESLDSSDDESLLAQVIAAGIELNKKRKRYPDDETTEDQIRQQFRTMQTFVRSACAAGRALKQHPITVSTGEVEPVYGQQTHQDRRNEIAKELINLDRYIARCRIDIDGQPREYTMHPTYIGEPDITPERERIVQDIIEHSRRQYCRPRAEVEAEIAARQRLDTGRGPRGLAGDEPL